MPAPKAKAKAKTTSAATMMREVEKRMDAMIAEYQEQMATYQKQYEDMVNEASRQLTAMTAQPPPKPQPKAIWHEEQGEKLLILNKEAAAFIVEILDNVGTLAGELQKITGAKQ